MVQKTYHITEFSENKLESVLRETLDSTAYREAARILLIIFEQNWDAEKINGKLALIRETLPKAEIVGCTHYDDMRQVERPEERSILSFLFFEESDFSIFRCSLAGKTEQCVGNLLKREMNAREDVRCVMALVSKSSHDIEKILKTANPAVPAFGATALMRGAFRSPTQEGYVFDTDCCYTETFLAVIFYGAKLRVKASYHLGWIPVGRAMTVTDTLDNYTVKEIDGEPAAEIYRKYLGLPYRRTPLNIVNICEFPMTTARGEFLAARIPYAWTDDGNLLFQIPVGKGERFRLSYGLPQQLFEEIHADADAFRTFQPQGILMVACMNRMVFLRERERLETDAYRRIAPDAAFLHGNSEIFWNDGAGSELHSAMIAVGLKEDNGAAAFEFSEPSVPAASEFSEPSAPAERSGAAAESCVIPLENRLMTFMRAVTGDLEETTAELLRLKENLEDEVERKTRQNESLSFHVVQTLAEAIDAKDSYTNGHSGRVAVYSREIARRAGYDWNACNEIYMMGLLHDVGKIGVPDAVINKPGKLTDEEYEQIKNHPVMGARILKAIREMPNLVTGARWHHEKYDGSGYPDGLKGEDIPEEARIIGVADAYDAMTSNRSYRRFMPQSAVREQIAKGKGTQFDPRFADIMLQMMDEDREYNMREK